MGVHPHAPMKGVQSPCPLLVPVFREAYDRTKPIEEGSEPPRSTGLAAERGPRVLAFLTVLKNASANPVTPAMAHGSKDAEGRLLGPSAATQRG